jgi:DNA-directed RNA polymerase subunit omega
MILYPMEDLLKDKISSRYELVNLVAHRAREIAREETNDEPLTEKPVTMALNEARDGKLVKEEQQEGF